MTGITALNLQASGGDSAWLGWPMIAVTWSKARDQVDANTEFLTEAGLRVGDHLTINVGRRLVTTTIVGQVYDPNGPSLSTSRQMLGAVPGLGVTSYRIGLAPGISPQRYSGKLSRRLGPSIGVLFACQGTSRSSGDIGASPGLDRDDRAPRRTGRAQLSADSHPGTGTRPGSLQVAGDDTTADTGHGRLRDHAASHRRQPSPPSSPSRPRRTCTPSPSRESARSPTAGCLSVLTPTRCVHADRRLPRDDSRLG